MACTGSYTYPIRIHPKTRAGECPACGTRFDWDQLVSELRVHMGDGTWGSVRKLPLHSRPGER